MKLVRATLVAKRIGGAWFSIDAKTAQATKLADSTARNITEAIAELKEATKPKEPPKDDDGIVASLR